MSHFVHNSCLELSLYMSSEARAPTGLTYLHTIERRTRRRRLNSPRAPALPQLDDSTPSQRFLGLTQSLSRRHASMMIQHRAGHIGLNKHLKEIGKSLTDRCPTCHNSAETVIHFLLESTGCLNWAAQVFQLVFKPAVYHVR